MSLKAIVYGELIWDVYPDKRVIGGAPFNFAAHVVHLGDEAYLVSAVGADELGDEAVQMMKKHGIKSIFLQTNCYPTGRCTVTLDESKIPSYDVHTDTAYDNIQITDTNSIDAIDADVFYFNTLIQRNAVSRASLRKILQECTFDDIFCDINIREGCFDARSLMLCMNTATIVKISDEEAHYLYDTGILHDDGKNIMYNVARAFPNIKLVVLTCGGDGSAVLDTSDGTVYESGKPPKTEVVSTVGAGDCFGATFLSSYFKHKDIQKAISDATLRSCIVVASQEAVPF